MPFATVLQFRARISERILQELSADAREEAVDEVRLQDALDDASAELDGWLRQVPENRRPADETLRVHCCKVALYLLTLDKPGKEYEQIRNAYTDTKAFYESLISGNDAAGRPPLEVSSCGPTPVFSDRNLKGFAP